MGTIQAWGQPVPEHGGVEKSEVWKVTQLSNGVKGQYAQMLKHGTKGSPERGRLWPR